MSDKGYYRGTVDAAERKIRAACPKVTLERWDYGFSMLGYKCDGEPIGNSRRVVFQAGRADIGQPEIIADVDELIKFWST
jgi:hypothetical protein